MAAERRVLIETGPTILSPRFNHVLDDKLPIARAEDQRTIPPAIPPAKEVATGPVERQPGPMPRPHWQTQLFSHMFEADSI